MLNVRLVLNLVLTGHTLKYLIKNFYMGKDFSFKPCFNWSYSKIGTQEVSCRRCTMF